MKIVSKSAFYFTVAIILPVCAHGTTILFDTSTATDWSVTGGGAQNVTPYVVPVQFYSAFPTYIGNVISVTSNAINTGTFLPGGSLANFDGYWTAIFTFSLPANAANVQLNYANFFADDRAILMLNGTTFDATGLIAYSQPNTGYMVLTDGGPALPYVFTEPFGQVSGTVTGGFNIGGINTLEAIINNTSDGIAATMNGNLAWNDGTGLGLTGNISYTIVPEPSFGALALLGACLVGAFRKAGLAPASVV